MDIKSTYVKFEFFIEDLKFDQREKEFKKYHKQFEEMQDQVHNLRKTLKELLKIPAVKENKKLYKSLLQKLGRRMVFENSQEPKIVWKNFKEFATYVGMAETHTADALDCMKHEVMTEFR